MIRKGENAQNRSVNKEDLVKELGEDKNIGGARQDEIGTTQPWSGRAIPKEPRPQYVGRSGGDRVGSSDRIT